MVEDRFDEALEQIQRAISKYPDKNMLLGFLVAALGNLNQMSEA